MTIGPSALTTGNVRMEMEAEMRRSLEDLINERRHMDSYYVLITAKPEPGTDSVRTVFMILPEHRKPPRMLGTICYYVDTRKGQLWRLWVLPWDIPVPGDLRDQDSKVLMPIVKSAEGLWLIH